MIININKIITSTKVVKSWNLPETSGETVAKNLTNLLKNLPEFRSCLLPNSRWAITQINRKLKSNNYIHPSESTKSQKLHSSIALAVDRGALAIKGINVHLKPILYLESVNEENWAKAFRISIPSKEDFLRKKYAVCWLYLLGRLEPVMRGFRPVSDIKIDKLPKNLKADVIEDWFSEILPTDLSGEILELLKSVNNLHLNGTFYSNPKFGGLGLITSSDGDWISGNTLVELKCTVGGLGNLYVSQLICYAALREINGNKLPGKMPAVNKLAFCLPRHNMMIIGTIDDWLQAFGAPPKEIVFKAIKKYFDANKC